MANASEYKYDHVTMKVLMSDMAFGPGAPAPGDRIPRFDLPLADGGRIDTMDFQDRKPLLVITGSYTCPMTASSNPLLKELHSEFGQDIDFVMLQVREAHPGEHVEQPSTENQKQDNARAMKARDQLPWPIAVDDVDGSVHRSLDEKPNAVWLTDRNGVIVYRGVWVGDDTALIQALDAAVRGVKPPQQDSGRLLSPMAMGIGKMAEMTGMAGPRARRDMWRAAPPMAALAWVADFYRPLPPKWRTVAAVGTIALAVTAVVKATKSRHR
ncbi:peroxiredoxin family protein [Massilia psychrophila]|uniref:Thioredoxin domain-containing protein n=1 Tax=Massilia psychrophila TaxID=1603353 RepID=A0A2G8SX88_9BURK|nr:redoxin family protein [Massilia psychrophila]PIL38098.1 hypothetical protein CR103_19950 [Massilia psychrophila]GGE88175.1 hypothetical protein GCM10008020_36460 [Massilia psychrophila]